MMQKKRTRALIPLIKRLKKKNKKNNKDRDIQTIVIIVKALHCISITENVLADTVSIYVENIICLGIRQEVISKNGLLADVERGVGGF